MLPAEIQAALAAEIAAHADTQRKLCDALALLEIFRQHAEVSAAVGRESITAMAHIQDRLLKIGRRGDGLVKATGKNCK